MTIFVALPLEMNYNTRISSKQLIKVALLVTVLVLLPRAIRVLEVTDFGSGYFTGATVTDLIYRAITIFLFALLVLELNVNGLRPLSGIGRYYRIGVVYLINIGLIFLAAWTFRFLHPRITGISDVGDEYKFLEAIFLGLMIILIFVSNIIKLQKIEQDKKLENAQLAEQNLLKELAALKNQVNPHFLFNSLNSLSGLVRDNDEATSFVKNLSFLYRYILQSGDIDQVSLKEELRFLESYLELIKVRFGDKIVSSIEIDPSYLSKEIPPLAIQLLVENAVKHNEMSEKNPLEIRVYSTGKSIVVANAIRPRKSMVESTGKGLANHHKRFELLIGTGISISKTDNIFKVELPLV